MTEQDWVIVTAVNEESGQAQVFRLRTTEPDNHRRRQLATAVSVAWGYESTGLFPEGSDKDQMLDFERTVDPLSESDFSELVLVATGGGSKEWLYYVSDPQRFLRELNLRLQDSPSYPLEIEWYEDDDWRLWRDIRELSVET